MLTAVCAGEVVAPPISSGIVKPWRCISRATCTISSSEGVISPDSPIMSAPSRRAVSRIFSHGTITPRSMTSKLLHWSTTPTMFLPMSCTSPLTVAMHDAAVAVRRGARGLARLDERHQVRDRVLHDARRLDHLRQEHLAGAEQVADHVHAVHQRALDHVPAAARCCSRASSVSATTILVDALHQRVLQPLAPPASRARPGPRRGACRPRP